MPVKPLTRAEREVAQFAAQHHLDLDPVTIKHLAGVAVDAYNRIELEPDELRVGDILNSTQLELLRLFANGLRIEQVAHRTGLGLYAVRGQVHAICTRLGAVDRGHAVAIGLARGLIPVGCVRIPPAVVRGEAGPRTAA